MKDRQYRSIVSFDTAGLPDNAVLCSVTLRIRRQGLVGGLPFTTHKKLLGDFISGAFSGVAALEAGDFQAASSMDGVLSLSAANANGKWSAGQLNAAGILHINLSGLTQFRLRFEKDDNDNQADDYLLYWSGEAAAGSQPELNLEYRVP